MAAQAPTIALVEAVHGPSCTSIRRELPVRCCLDMVPLLSASSEHSLPEKLLLVAAAHLLPQHPHHALYLISGEGTGYFPRWEMSWGGARGCFSQLVWTFSFPLTPNRPVKENQPLLWPPHGPGSSISSPIFLEESRLPPCSTHQPLWSSFSQISSFMYSELWRMVGSCHLAGGQGPHPHRWPWCDLQCWPFQCISILLQGFPGGSDSKESACNAGDPGLIPGFDS